MKPLNIYLAGKIGSTSYEDRSQDWRNEIVSGQCHHTYHEHQSIQSLDEYNYTHDWPILEKVISGKHHFTGPYVMQNMGGHGFSAYDVSDNSHSLEDKRGRKSIYANCLGAIRKSSLVFAWIETNDCYGTISEIGYAKGLGKFIVIASPIVLQELWFVYQMADLITIANDPKSAFFTTINSIEKAAYNLDKFTHDLEKCESPIEETFFLEAYDKIPGLEAQYKIERYRVDFAIPDKKIAIEIDGHDYHKTKEQRTNDAKRERDLKTFGWDVIRFTGSEVYKNVEECVSQLAGLIKR